MNDQLHPQSGPRPLCFDLSSGWSNIVGINISHGMPQWNEGSDVPLPIALVRINGEDFPTRLKQREPLSLAGKVAVDLRKCYVRTFEVFLRTPDGALTPVQPVEGGVYDLVFKHSVEKAHQEIRRRKGLAHGPRQQLMAALQNYFFGVEMADIAIQATSICSTAYRYCDMSDNVKDDDLADLDRKVHGLMPNLAWDSSEGNRWLPSIMISTGQAHLLHGNLERAKWCLRAASDRYENISIAPISAYNIALSTCLLTYILWKEGDPTCYEIGARWQAIFRNAVANMPIRFGTMHEFGVIYSALYLNYRIILMREEERDRRMKIPTYAEVMKTCIRSKLTDSVVAALERIDVLKD